MVGKINMTPTHDLVVLGAGPAGSLTALVAARAGLSVVVIDKSTFPRPKICGDCVNPRSWALWRRLGLEEGFSRLPHHRIKSLRLSHDFRDPVEFPMKDDGEEERAVSREILDQWLKDEARIAGVEYQTGTVPLSLGPDQTLTCDRGQFRGRILVGADGRNSWLARAAGLNRPGRRCRRIAWQTSLPGSVAGDAVHMSFFKEGYFGLARNNAATANLCMVLREGSETTAQEVAERYFPGCGPREWRSTNPINRAPSIAAEKNILLVGDAARVVEPFTGEGIYLALSSGELAGKMAVEAIQKGDDASLAMSYRKAHAKLYQNLSWQNPLTRWLGSHPEAGCRALKWLRLCPPATRMLCRPFL
jgi:flavin-dependent dehydrogenase